MGNHKRQQLLREEAIKQELEANYKKADTVMVYLGLSVMVYVLVQGAIHNAIMESLIMSIGALTPFLLTLFFIKNRRIKNRLIGFLFILIVAVVIASSRGAVEARYWYFSAISLLVIYQSIPLIISGGVVAIVFNLLVFPIPLMDLPGKEIVDEYLLEPANQSWWKFGLTLFWVVVSIVISSMVAQRLRKRTVQGLELQLTQQEQIEIYLENKKIADEIAQGNLDNLVINAGDELGRSLRNILQNLKDNLKKERAEKYISEGLSEINRIFREEEYETAFRRALIFIGDHIGAQAGILLILKEGQRNKPVEERLLILKNSFGVETSHIQEEGMLMGEGLLGQVSFEGELRIIEDVPDDYMMVNSGLGQSAPKSLALVPLEFDETVVGGMELASLNNISEEKRSFLSQASTVMGSAILRYLIGLDNESILSEAQTKATEFEKRENEYTLRIGQLEEKIRAMERGE